MDRVPIPDDVKQFVLVSIPSVPYLEAMLLLRGDSAHRWNRNQVAQRLYMSDEAAAALLQELEAAGIVHVIAWNPALYCYKPANNELARVIDLLAAVYARNLVAITTLIHSKTGKDAQQVADAFKWKTEQ